MTESLDELLAAADERGAEAGAGQTQTTVG